MELLDMKWWVSIIDFKHSRSMKWISHNRWLKYYKQSSNATLNILFFTVIMMCQGPKDIYEGLWHQFSMSCNLLFRCVVSFLNCCGCFMETGGRDNQCFEKRKINFRGAVFPIMYLAVNSFWELVTSSLIIYSVIFVIYQLGHEKSIKT